MTSAELIRHIEKSARQSALDTGRSRFAAPVLAAMAKVQRDHFVRAADMGEAWQDKALPIECGQTISQPFIVALMTELLDLKPHDNVLEIGTGSGYQTAVLAELTDRLCSIEVVPELAEKARQTLAREGCATVALRCGDGALGWPERAPFDAIIVTAAAGSVPPALIEQLAPAGRMVIPLGPPADCQDLRLYRKYDDGSVDYRSCLPVAFVPFTGSGAS